VRRRHGVDVERACGAILEANRPRPCMQFEILYHVAVERSQGSKRAHAFDRVERHVEKDTVQVHANPAVVGTAQGEARVIVIVRTDTWEALNGAERIVCQYACEVFGVVAGQHEGGGTVLGRDVEGRRLHLYRIRLAEGIGAEGNLEILGFTGIQVKRLLDKPVSNSGNVQDVVACCNGGDLELSRGVRRRPTRAAHELNHDIGEHLATTCIDHRATNFARHLLRIARYHGQEAAE
jgi:hypothetical protein